MKPDSHHRPESRVPMAAVPWRAGMARLALRAEAASAGTEADVLAEALTLLAHAPHATAALNGIGCDIASVAALITAGAWESAALAMVPTLGAYMLSRGGTPAHVASVLLPGFDEEVTMRGDSAALALTAAIAAALGNPAPRASHLAHQSHIGRRWLH